LHCTWGCWPWFGCCKHYKRRFFIQVNVLLCIDFTICFLIFFGNHAISIRQFCLWLIFFGEPRWNPLVESSSQPHFFHFHRLKLRPCIRDLSSVSLGPM
jgi:hypothetical protein